MLPLQVCKSFEHFFCFHRTLGISPKDLEGFTALALSLTILQQILTFVTRNFIGPWLSDARFDWLFFNSFIDRYTCYIQQDK